jgi:RimJ/RimL family protein N-acetyltransferase
VAERLQTERLLLRRLAPADADAFAALHADREVMRFIGEGEPLSGSRSDELLARIERQRVEHGFGLWAAELRGTAELAGFVGLAAPAFLTSVAPAAELGWCLGRRWWGRGLATEGARAIVHFGFERLGLAQIVCVVDPANTASLRVAEKLSMRRGPDRRHPGTGRRLSVMELIPGA